MRRSHAARRATHLLTRAGLLACVLVAAAACGDPTGPAPRPRFSPAASVRWNQVARDLVTKYRTDPPLASRVYALTSVAQDRGVAGALAYRGAGGTRAVDHAAAVGASAEVLTALYPPEARMLDSLARGDLADPLWSSDTLVSVAAGDEVGRAAGRALLAERATDGSDATWTGVVPTGAGVWFSSATPAPPLRPRWGEVRPWLLARGDALRPEPPPAPGSAAFQAALAEVRRYSDARTQRELDVAKHWGDGAGTYTPPGHWNRTASDLAVWYNVSEGDAAHVLALVNTAMMDAGIAAWDAKYAYWLARPSQLDAAITTPIGLPNFPSYVSGHAAFSGAAAAVLGHLFPAEREQLGAQADEAAMSRLYGGIHYRFDSDVGLRMGRAVAALAVGREASRGGRTFTRAPLVRP